jgi:hypothetical protein
VQQPVLVATLEDSHEESSEVSGFGSEYGEFRSEILAE